MVPAINHLRTEAESHCRVILVRSTPTREFSAVTCHSHSADLEEKPLLCQDIQLFSYNFTVDNLQKKNSNGQSEESSFLRWDLQSERVSTRQ